MTAKPRASCRLETIELRQSCPGGQGNVTRAASNIQTGVQECKGEHPLILTREWFSQLFGMFCGDAGAQEALYVCFCLTEAF